MGICIDQLMRDVENHIPLIQPENTQMIIIFKTYNITKRIKFKNLKLKQSLKWSFWKLDEAGDVHGENVQNEGVVLQDGLGDVVAGLVISFKLQNVKKMLFSIKIIFRKCNFSRRKIDRSSTIQTKIPFLIGPTRWQLPS